MCICYTVFDIIETNSLAIYSNFHLQRDASLLAQGETPKMT